MKLELHRHVEQEGKLIDLLHSHSQLSKSVLKKALAFGGVWIKRGKAKKQRCRRATKILTPGDQYSLFFDDRLYGDPPPNLQLLQHTQHWGIWFKPANVVSQGTPYGDKGCLLELVKTSSQQRECHLINRLDREVAGIVLIAYSKTAARALSDQWSAPTTRKYYQALVAGRPRPETGTVSIPLDGKPSVTRYETLSYCEPLGATYLQIQIHSGRFHQIRRHMSLLGHSVLGDPKYGDNNGCKEGLQLIAYRLAFQCPITMQNVDCRLSDEKCLINSQLV